MPTSKQRREAQRRRLQRRVRRRAQREARRRRTLLVVSVVGALAVVALVVGFVVMTGNDSSTTSSTSKTSPSTSSSPSPTASSTAASYPCTWTRSGTAARTVTVPATTRPPRTGTVRVSVTTTRGALTFTLDRSKAPCAVASFVSLAEQHFYDSTPCHRLTTGSLSVLQCGDPTATGRGGPGYRFNDELTGREKYTRGVIAMANSGPNTNGSQFFIVYKDSQLGPDYTVFGTVTKGLGVVDKVAAKGARSDGKPTLPITLTKVLVLN